MPLPDLIAAVNDRLTPTERRIAEVVLREPTLLAFGTVSDLAGLVGTSRPSIVRFANKLGFGGYSELQTRVRSGMSERLSRPAERIRTPKGSSTEVHEALTESVTSAFAALEGERLDRLTRPVIQAQRVWILSGETSRAGAHALHSGLSMVRPGVRLVEEHSSGSDLSSAEKGDAAVVFDFARYRRHAITAARTLVEIGVDLVAVTDGPLSPLASMTDTWCELSVPAVGPFDSSVPAVAFAELFTAQVATQLRDAAEERIDRTEALWEATGTFLP